MASSLTRSLVYSCPYCANLLTIEDTGGQNKWACKTCPYEYPIEKNVRVSCDYLAMLSLGPADSCLFAASPKLASRRPTVHGAYAFDAQGS